MKNHTKILFISFLIIMQKLLLIHTILYFLEKKLTFHNVIMLLKSVFNKDKNNYYYNIFLEKGSYKLPKNNDNK